MLGMESGIAAAILVLFFIVFIFLFILAFTVSYKIPQELFYGDCPSLVFLYAKALFVSLGRKQGQFQLDDGGAGPQVVKDGKNKIVARDCRIDRSRLTQYAIVCSYGDEPLSVPPCYLETYFMPLLIALTSSEKFKLSPLGLIHVRQTITQHTDIQHLLREPFDLECTVVEYRRTEKGIEVDMSMRVYDRREMCVWEGVATLLSRGKKAASSGGGHTIRMSSDRTGRVSGGVNSSTVLPEVYANESTKTETMVLRIPANLGLKYAKASGDWNPHHLWPWTSKLLGYKKPVAHGMWTMARCLTWLDRSGKFEVKAPFQVDVQFKRPIFLPDSSVFTFMPQLDKEIYAFRVNDEKTQVPQLMGKITKRV